MLAADKLQLQSALKQQATALKEKEFNLHHSNLMTVGTQAAVLAGLDITMFIEFAPPSDDEWGENAATARVLKMLYNGIIVGAFCANMLVVSHTTALSVLGAGLALRGPDGSMMVATDGLYEERKSVFRVFALGLGLTVGSLLLSVWLLLYWEAALACFCIAAATCRQMYRNYMRVAAKFGYDESLTVDFHDIMNGPAAITAVPSTLRYAARAIQDTVGGRGGGSNSRRGGYSRSRSRGSNSAAGGGGSDYYSSDDEYDDYNYDDGGGGDVEAQRLTSNNSSRRDVKRRGTTPRRKGDPLETV